MCSTGSADELQRSRHLFCVLGCLLVCYIPLVNNALQTNTDVYSTHAVLNYLRSLRTIAGIEGACSDRFLFGARGARTCTAVRRTQIGSRDAKRDRPRNRTTMQSTPATPSASAAPTTPDTPDTPETLLLDADAELAASHPQRAPTPETRLLTGADAELRAVLRETPQRARAAVQAVVGRIVDAPDDERFQRINAESRTFRETGLEEGRALLAALGFVEDGAHLIWSGDLDRTETGGPPHRLRRGRGRAAWITRGRRGHEDPALRRAARTRRSRPATPRSWTCWRWTRRAARCGGSRRRAGAGSGGTSAAPSARGGCCGAGGARSAGSPRRAEPGPAAGPLPRGGP